MAPQIGGELSAVMEPVRGLDAEIEIATSGKLEHAREVHIWRAFARGCLRAGEGSFGNFWRP